MTEINDHTEDQTSFWLPAELVERLKIPADVPPADVARGTVGALMEQLRNAPDGKIVIDPDALLALIGQGEQFANLKKEAMQRQAEIERSNAARETPVAPEATPLRLVSQPDSNIETDYTQVA